ncbi:hypothetical protein ACQP0C_36150 [Nocardia sp. CA-129566]|uniref:hypothetical protein n=1 Tax=Nocardia sp. CA-129566 TaxID=3239976 RepID=UPI003D97A5CF
MTLAVGDPVTLVDGIANRGNVGSRSHGVVAGFGRVNVQVRISDSWQKDLIGKVFPVPGKHLEYGHFGYVRASDGIAATITEFTARHEVAIERDADAMVRSLIIASRGLSIITREQAEQILALWRRTASPSQAQSSSS